MSSHHKRILGDQLGLMETSGELYWWKPQESYVLEIGLPHPRWLSGKESTCQCRRHRFSPWAKFNLWVRNIPWRRKWQFTPVFLPGKYHGQRRLTGCTPCGCKRVRHDIVTEQQHMIQTHIHQTWEGDRRILIKLLRDRPPSSHY